MHFDVYSLIFLLFADCITVFLIYGLCKRFETRLLGIVSVFCFNIASCLGILMNSENSSYLPSAIAYLLLMVLVMIKILDGKFSLSFGNRTPEFINDKSIENQRMTIRYLGILCFAIVVISTFYPVNYLTQISQSSFAITGQRFALSISRSGGLAWIMDRVKLVLLPFFFIWLYMLRHNWKKFIGVFLVYSLCDMLQNALITSRSNYLQLIVFILIYLTLEKIITKRQLVISSIVIGVLGVVVMVWFKDLIMGKSLSYNGFNDYLNALLQSEYSGGQARLNYCNSVSGDLDFFHFIYHCFTAPLFFLPDDGFPTLSYYFTSGVLGLQYGQVGYYVILPGAFGEGVMVLGKYFAWIYGLFIGLYAGSYFRFLRRRAYFRYIYVYFLIQFGFAFRGGMQAFVMRSLNCLFYFLIVMLLLRVLDRTKVKRAVISNIAND